jgi:hypothetical protein
VARRQQATIPSAGTSNTARRVPLRNDAPDWRFSFAVLHAFSSSDLDCRVANRKALVASGAAKLRLSMTSPPSSHADAKPGFTKRWFLGNAAMACRSSSSSPTCSASRLTLWLSLRETILIEQSFEARHRNGPERGHFLERRAKWRTSPRSVYGPERSPRCSETSPTHNLTRIHQTVEAAGRAPLYAPARRRHTASNVRGSNDIPQSNRCSGFPQKEASQ